MAEYIEREEAIKAIAEDKIEMTPELIAIGRAIGTYTAEQAFDAINQACDRHIESINRLKAANVISVDDGIKMGVELASMHGSDATSQDLEKSYWRGFEDAMQKRDVQPVKHGRWLTEYEPDGKPYCFHCSVCDSDFSIVGNKIAYDYCPDCGAKMDMKHDGYR